MPRVTARVEEWQGGGAVLRLRCSTGGAAEHAVWHRVLGAAGLPWVTLIHGFPTSSFDMVEVAASLQASRQVLAFDMVGLGMSDRPLDHVYSVVEQADAVCALWALHGVEGTAVVAHDLGASVAQELLHRSLRGALPVRLRCVVLANGGIFPDLHRPLPFQTALADPEHGASVAAAMTEEAFAPSLRLTFGSGHQPRDERLREMWTVIARDGGNRNLHLLIRYMAERREREADWVGALTSTPAPLGFVWGMEDPISGAHIAARIESVLPAAPRRFLDDVGHWPPIEAPGAVVEVLRELDSL
jgi:pimeloyl-ACP methyl ester carboxylesterase